MYVIKKSLSSVVVLTTFLLTTSAFAMDPDEEDANPCVLAAMKMNFNDMPKEVRGLIVKRAACEQCLGKRQEEGFWSRFRNSFERSSSNNDAPVTLGNLVLVCKGWNEIINNEKKVGTEIWKAWYGVTPENEHIYQQFLNGTLIYRPIPQSDEGMIELKISGNPLEGTFDLSQCGDAGKYLSISTGYRKKKKPENSKKLEIWLAPRFMIEKKLKPSASPLQPIMDSWNEDKAPISILFINGDWNYLTGYDYLTSAGVNDIFSKDLYQNWHCALPQAWTRIHANFASDDLRAAMRQFHVQFANQNKDY